MLTEVIFTLLSYVLGVLFWSILVSALISVLLSFNVLDRRNRFVWSMADFLYKLTDPVIRPLRRVLPEINGLDLSPWAALVLLQIVRGIILPYFYAGIHFGTWGSLL